jgi:hypothetical protein
MRTTLAFLFDKSRVVFLARVLAERDTRFCRSTT